MNLSIWLECLVDGYLGKLNRITRELYFGVNQHLATHPDLKRWDRVSILLTENGYN